MPRGFRMNVLLCQFLLALKWIGLPAQSARGSAEAGALASSQFDRSVFFWGAPGFLLGSGANQISLHLN